MPRLNLVAAAPSLARFSLHFWALDFAAGFCIAAAHAIFRGIESGLSLGLAAIFGVFTALVGARASCMRPPRTAAAVITFVAAFATLGLVAFAVLSFAKPTPSWQQAAWLAIATSAVGAGFRLAFRALKIESGSASLGESGRWLILGAAAFAVGFPFFTSYPRGAGDAYWYTLMVADFIEQVRAGQFPVWAGVTEYAFNGSVSPLRLAPWLQHAAAALDLVTARTLGPTALVNLLMWGTAFTLAATTYLGVRSILPERANLACLLTVVVLLSPATIAPNFVGDQYMTYAALPFLPLVCCGLWHAARRPSAGAHLLLAAGAAGLWLAHPPIALWTSLLVAPLYAVVLLLRRSREYWKVAGLSLLVFFTLGTYSIHSAVTLENTNPGGTLGGSVVEELRAAFPANFGRLSKAMNETHDYQAGAAGLVLFAGVLAWLPRRRTAEALLPGAACLFVFLLIVPIPVVTDQFWELVPKAVLKASNRWINQRLFPIWIILIVFAFAAIHRNTRAPGSRSLKAALAALCIALLGWSGNEAWRLVDKSRRGIDPGIGALRLLERENVIPTRYSFVSFEYAPGYFSHGYIDPVFEHRILRADLSELSRNSEAAVGRGGIPARNRTLLAEGMWRGVNESDQPLYDLLPKLDFPTGERAALWLDAVNPGERSWIQIKGPKLFREYMLPDSGVGVSNLERVPPRGFGTLPTSSKVISILKKPAVDPDQQLIYIAPDRPVSSGFDVARFELWKYDPESLPVVVKSWIPYRIIVDSPEAGYVETPRLWMRGYRARVNGVTVPVERSPDNLAMFKIPAGWTDVTIRYIPALPLELHFWATLLGWVALALHALHRLLFGHRSAPSAVTRELRPTT